ncbi:MAG: glycosyltransferase family 4 protein [Deltaproteobacteria bacterium]|nr:glycosyltransferase family 4 protein [Deltaproteobacteria bacterium]
MRVLMFGWEFPPHMSGGLGTACFGMTKAITDLGHDVIFVLPKVNGVKEKTHVKLVSAADIPVSTRTAESSDTDVALTSGLVDFGRLTIRPIHSVLSPYLTSFQYENLLQHSSTGIVDREQAAEYKWFLGNAGGYGPNLLAEVARYGDVAGAVATQYAFDIIHAHDWMTVFAGLIAKKASGKPLVLHIHALEFDRSGENINQDIYEIERSGMEGADRIIAVSNYTKQRIVSLYNIDPRRISVIHNAVSQVEARQIYHMPSKNGGRKVVLFLGRITFQKGPDYFIEAAAKVLKVLPDITFVMAGTGDMMPRMVERVAELGLGKNFHFTGFLRGADVEQMFAASDLYVMPSVSEPFGISPLEAMLYDVPVIISKQSGVTEILKHALKVDFWDVDEMANKIIAVLKYPVLFDDIVERSREEIKHIRWEAAAGKIVDVYRDLMH